MLPIELAGLCSRGAFGWVSHDYTSSPNIGASTIPTRNVAFREIGGLPDDMLSPLGGAAASEGDGVAVVDTVEDVSVTDFALADTDVLDVLDVLVVDGFGAPSPLA